MWRSAAVWAFLLGCAGAAGGGELAGERWAGKDTPCAHPGTLRWIQSGKTPRLVFDLSVLPKEARIHRASLRCVKQGDGQPADPVRIHVTESLDAEGNAVFSGKPLALEGPWYRSLDATEAVRLWSREPGKNLGFAVASFEGLVAPQTCLDILYEGAAKDVPPQVEELRALHHDGQTFLVWKEHAAFRPAPEEVIWVERWDERGDKLAGGSGEGADGLPRSPAITLRTLRRLQGLGLRDKPSGFQGIKPLQRVAAVPPVRYRVYRHERPITPRSLPEAQLLAEVEPLSAYDEKMSSITFQGEYLDQMEVGDSPIPAYCAEDGRALRPGEALYVHTPAHRQGKSHYAVTAVLAGTENACEIAGGNSLAEPVEEKLAPPRPVLQHIQRDQYVAEVAEEWYLFWAAPPYYNLPGAPFHIAVGVPKGFKGPGPMTIGAPAMGGSFNLRGDVNMPSRTAITLIIEQHVPWGADLCFSEGRGTLRAFQETKIDFFSERYMSHLINWATAKWPIDRARISGSMLHFGLRHPEIFARMSFGAYTASYDTRWDPGSRTLPGLLGPQGGKTVEGGDAWSEFSVSRYVNRHPERDIPYLVCISAVGKDSGHTSEFGWQDDPRGWAGLLQARQPFVATWGSEQGRGWFLHPEMSAQFDRMRWDVTLPAFSGCSLDNNPGNGDPSDGDPCGQINGYLLWDDAEQVDQADRWEMNVYLVGSCPRDSCVVDITPRHCKAFRPRAGEKFGWTNTSLAEKREIQAGYGAEADPAGLVTLEKAIVSRGRNRIRIAR